MKKNKLSDQFDKIEIGYEDLKSLASETDFIKRNRLVSGPDMLYAICAESVHGTVSYNDIASQIESEAGASVSKQAVWKKVTEPCLDFFQKVLERVILSRIDKGWFEKIKRESQYKRILVQDSTIIKLPSKLHSVFSGVANQHSKVCNARIQVVYDILNERFVYFSIDSYSISDSIAAPELKLQEGDLCLRDRGYLIYDEIQRHIAFGADCIYRYKYGLALLDINTEQPINLLEELKKRKVLEMVVKLNNEAKTMVRITAYPVDEKTANKRRMKAKQEKKRLHQSNTLNHSVGQYSLQQLLLNKQITKPCLASMV